MVSPNFKFGCSVASVCLVILAKNQHVLGTSANSQQVTNPTEHHGLFRRPSLLLEELVGISSSFCYWTFRPLALTP